MSTSAQSQAPLTFWSYLDVAGERIRERDTAADAEATELLMLLNRASDAIVRDFEAEALKAHELTWSRFRVLHSLWLSGGLEPREVAEVTGMSRALVSSTAKQLMGRGLIGRTAAEHDGRMRRLFLTDEGDEVIAGAFRDQNRRESEWVGTLTEAERGLLGLLLQKLARGGREG